MNIAIELQLLGKSKRWLALATGIPVWTIYRRLEKNTWQVTEMQKVINAINLQKKNQ
jgi:hypothetical protein